MLGIIWVKDQMAANVYMFGKLHVIEVLKTEKFSSHQTHGHF